MYTLFLISIAMIMALVILNLSIEIFNNNEYQNIVRKLSNNIVYKADLAFKYNKLLNSNGSWFLDTTSCPTSISMSGSISSGVVASTVGYSSWRLICSGTYSGTWFQILWNNDYSAFSWAYFRGTSIVFATGATASGTFTDIDNTRMSFTTTWLGWIDNIDDNLNSDNYKVTSTGAVYYPNWGEDDDVLARKTIYFYLPPGGGYTNILWANTKYNDFIKNNANNTDTLNKVIWQVWSGHIFLDVDKNFSLKVVKFNKTKYNTYKELEPIEVFKSPQMFGRLWYIQNNGTVSTGWIDTKTWQEMIFDFINNDYAIFLSNYSTWTLFFNLKWFSTTGSGIYVSPINDSDVVIFKYLWNDMIMDSEGRYLSNQFEVINLK